LPQASLPGRTVKDPSLRKEPSKPAAASRL
jgi:hypothetical protein